METGILSEARRNQIAHNLLLSEFQNNTLRMDTINEQGLNQLKNIAKEIPTVTLIELLQLTAGLINDTFSRFISYNELPIERHDWLLPPTSQYNEETWVEWIAYRESEVAYELFYYRRKKDGLNLRFRNENESKEALNEKKAKCTEEELKQFFAEIYMRFYNEYRDKFSKQFANVQ